MCKLWGKIQIPTEAMQLTSISIEYSVALTTNTFCTLLTMRDARLGNNNLERPVGFVDDENPPNRTGFTLKNFSEQNSGSNSYYWLAIGK